MEAPSKQAHHHPHILPSYANNGNKQLLAEIQDLEAAVLAAEVQSGADDDAHGRLQQHLRIARIRIDEGQHKLTNLHAAVTSEKSEAIFLTQQADARRLGARQMLRQTRSTQAAATQVRSDAAAALGRLGRLELALGKAQSQKEQAGRESQEGSQALAQLRQAVALLEGRRVETATRLDATLETSRTAAEGLTRATTEQEATRAALGGLLAVLRGLEGAKREAERAWEEALGRAEALRERGSTMREDRAEIESKNLRMRVEAALGRAALARCRQGERGARRRASASARRLETGLGRLAAAREELRGRRAEWLGAKSAACAAAERLQAARGRLEEAVRVARVIQDRVSQADACIGLLEGRTMEGGDAAAQELRQTAGLEQSVQVEERQEKELEQALFQLREQLRLAAAENVDATGTLRDLESDEKTMRAALEGLAAQAAAAEKRRAIGMINLYAMRMKIFRSEEQIARLLGIRPQQETQALMQRLASLRQSLEAQDQSNAATERLIKQAHQRLERLSETVAHQRTQRDAMVGRVRAHLASCRGLKRRVARTRRLRMAALVQRDLCRVHLLHARAVLDRHRARGVDATSKALAEQEEMQSMEAALQSQLEHLQRAWARETLALDAKQTALRSMRLALKAARKKTAAMRALLEHHSEHQLRLEQTSSQEHRPPVDLAALEEQVHALRQALEETQRANRALAQDKKSTSAKELQHRRDVLKQDLWKALREQTDLKKALSSAAADLTLGRSTLGRAEENVARIEADLRRAQAQQAAMTKILIQQKEKVDRAVTVLLHEWRLPASVAEPAGARGAKEEATEDLIAALKPPTTSPSTALFAPSATRTLPLSPVKSASSAPGSAKTPRKSLATLSDAPRAWYLAARALHGAARALTLALPDLGLDSVLHGSARETEISSFAGGVEISVTAPPSSPAAHSSPTASLLQGSDEGMPAPPWQAPRSYTSSRNRSTTQSSRLRRVSEAEGEGAGSRRQRKLLPTAPVVMQLGNM